MSDMDTLLREFFKYERSCAVSFPSTGYLYLCVAFLYFVYNF